jgi:hypothetical protein
VLAAVSQRLVSLLDALQNSTSIVTSSVFAAFVSAASRLSGLPVSEISPTVRRAPNVEFGSASSVPSSSVHTISPLIIGGSIVGAVICIGVVILVAVVAHRRRSGKRKPCCPQKPGVNNVNPFATSAGATVLRSAGGAAAPLSSTSVLRPPEILSRPPACMQYQYSSSQARLAFFASQRRSVSSRAMPLRRSAVSSGGAAAAAVASSTRNPLRQQRGRHSSKSRMPSETSATLDPRPL